MTETACNPITKLLCFLTLVGISISISQGKPDSKLTPAELVTRHLQSIGSAEARAGHGTRIKGTCLLTVRQGGSGQVSGQTVMASKGNQNLLNMIFEADSTSAWLKFDGQKSTVSQFRPGVRTPLENFFALHEVIIKEGLLGGTLSESWPLLNLPEKTPKLEYGGIKKVGGRELHALKYSPLKGSDLKITLFFDMQTFQHVRTEYERTIYASEHRRIAGGGGAVPPATSQRATNTRINAHEEFSDFRPEGGLNLPHVYKFELSIQSETRPALVDWIVNLNDFKFGVPLDVNEVGGPGS